VEFHSMRPTPAHSTSWPRRRNGVVWLSCRLRPDRSAPKKGRDMLEPFGHTLEPALFEDLKLVVTELLTTSGRDGDDNSLHLTVQIAPAKVFLQVQGLPAASKADEFCDLRVGLIQSLADRWAVEADGRKIRVEFNRTS
jgi:hypothetical protein